MKRIFKTIGLIICMLLIALATLSVYNVFATESEKDRIKPKGQMIDLGDYSVHVYSEGENDDMPTLVFMSGSATVAPVYDFKPLYSLLSDDYRIAVVEKAGYGYSDIVEVERDVATMVDEVRNALSLADIDGPYILMPHSMSGLEALYWAQNYPEEVAGIIGLDMAVPSAYDEYDHGRVMLMATLGRLSRMLGLLRIPGLYPVNTSALSEEEAEQQRLLINRNAVNKVYIEEGKYVYDNAQIVKEGGPVSCPILLFCSNGKEIGDFWISSMERFAKENNAVIEYYDCGHYIHYYKSEEMSELIKEFIKMFIK